MTGIAAKWRPSMALVVCLVCLVLVSVPVFAFLSMRLTSNQFVRETEQSLIDQAALYAAAYATAFKRTGVAPAGATVEGFAAEFWDAPLHPTAPRLNLRRSPILPPLPEFETTLSISADPPGAPYAEIAPMLLGLARAAQRSTLSGVVFLDGHGVSIRTDQTVDLSFAPEVQEALSGRVGTALRDRGDTYDRHPLTSISRDTWYRVFVAYPVLVEGRVVGAVYLSRTPSNLRKFVVNERAALGTMLGATLLAALAVGALLLRFILRPVRALSAQSQGIANGTTAQTEPLRQYGIRELAELGQSVMRMSKTLTDRSRQIATYTDHVTHELKSPVTAIVGAAELLTGTDIPSADRHALLRSIEAQGRRMNVLLEKLREMIRLRDMPTTGHGPIAEMLPDIPALEIRLGPASEDILPMLAEHGRIVLHQLAQNAYEADAQRVTVSYVSGVLRIRDDGRGIASGDLARVAQPFFTTRREEGGTGLGLAIVTAILQNYGAALSFEPVGEGASVVIAFAESKNAVPRPRDPRERKA